LSHLKVLAGGEVADAGTVSLAIPSWAVVAEEAIISMGFATVAGHTPTGTVPSVAQLQLLTGRGGVVVLRGFSILELIRSADRSTDTIGGFKGGEGGATQERSIEEYYLGGNGHDAFMVGTPTR
jgi:hypothetical protein